MILPPEIRDFDLVRMEDNTLTYWREQDMLQQVMHGEKHFGTGGRVFSMNICQSGRAEEVTELYRAEYTEDGMHYKLIWHRPPRGIASEYSFMNGKEQDNGNLFR